MASAPQFPTLNSFEKRHTQQVFGQTERLGYDQHGRGIISFANQAGGQKSTTRERAILNRSIKLTQLSCACHTQLPLILIKLIFRLLDRMAGWEKSNAKR
jgi:hypothetical protein